MAIPTETDLNRRGYAGSTSRARRSRGSDDVAVVGDDSRRQVEYEADNGDVVQHLGRSWVSRRTTASLHTPILGAAA